MQASLTDSAFRKTISASSAKELWDILEKEMKLLMRLWVMLQTFHTCWDYGRPEMKELMRLYVTIHRFLRLCKKMRCFTSTPKETGGNRRKPTSIGSHLQFKVPFNWVNQEDEEEETEMSNVWYEVLSVLHLMAMLQMSQANLLLLPRGSSDGHNHPKVSEENRRASIDIFLKAAGYLDCAVKNVLPQFSAEQRRILPVDLGEGVLRALCLQALGQGVDIQLGMAIDSSKATLAVKRRLSCEMVKYWQQAQDNLMNLPLANGWGEKHGLFVKWKYVEAKAAAYYYHGLILDEGNTEKSHGMAVAALQAADECFKESKKASEAFNASSPTSRTPPLFGTMKYLTEKIPKDTSSKVRINRDLYSYEKIMETAPTLPDFALALKPDEYQLPLVEDS